MSCHSENGKAKRPRRCLMNELLYDEDFKRNIADHYRSGNAFQNDTVELIDVPFHCGVIRNFIRSEEYVKELKKDLLSLDFNEKSNDLYQFQQSNDLKTSEAVSIQTMRDILYKDFLGCLTDVTGITFNGTMDISCAKYSYTDTLLCHDDELEGRRVAFIFYLVPPWHKEDGGTLDLFSVDDNGQPAEITKVLVPSWNSLVFFEVTPVSFHQVSEVLNKEKCRLSISGWFHGETAPRPMRKPEPRQKIEPPHSLEDDALLEWINPTYLNAEIADSIQEQLEENSEIQLPEFILEDKYKLLVKELQSRDFKWKTRGPANKRNYEIADDQSVLPPTLESFSFMMRSKPMFKLLARLTGLNLAELESRDNDQPSGSSQTDDKESSSESKPGCYGEVRRWSHGCYTLVHDTDPHLVDFALDAMVFFGCDGRDSVAAGGFTSYIASGEDEELLSVHPTSNCLALVYRDKETLRFVKYINHSSLNSSVDLESTSETRNEFYDISLVYYE